MLRKAIRARVFSGALGRRRMSWKKIRGVEFSWTFQHGNRGGSLPLIPCNLPGSWFLTLGKHLGNQGLSCGRIGVHKKGLSKRDSGLITGDLILGFWED